MDSVINWFASPATQRLLVVVASLVLVPLLARTLGRLLSARLSDPDARYRARKISTGLGYAAIVLVIVGVYSARLQGLGVFLGVAGAGIAFALQEVIASVAGWVALTFSRFYAPGDRVQLGGIKGDVIDIGILRTTLMEVGEWVKGDLYTGRIVRVANSFVFKEPVFNYSGDFPFLWDEISIPVKYGSDRARARTIIEAAAEAVVGEYAASAKVAWARLVRAYRIEDARIEPMVHLVANDNWIEYTLRYVVDYKRRRVTKDALFTQILDAIDASGGTVALASATFHLVEWPPLDIRMAGGARATAAQPDAPPVP